MSKNADAINTELLDALEMALALMIFEYADFGPDEPETRAIAAAEAAIANAKKAKQ